jgi:hypothetical protein
MSAIKKYRMSLLFICFICSTLLTGACNYITSENGSGESKPENTAEENAGRTGAEAEPADETGAKTAENTGVCANEYYPVTTEKDLAYKVTGATPASYVLTRKKTAADSFTETRNFSSGINVKTNWVCTEDGLRNVEYNSGMNFSSGNFKMETLESSGMTLPKTWEAGKKWTTEYKIKGKLKAGPVNADTSGTVLIENEITSLGEKVKTPAGEFETAKVVSTINLNLSVGGSVKVATTNWYAPGVGLVKQEAKSPFGGKETIEYTGEK